jgi:Tfp pilus assembly protein PilZ
MSVSVPVGLYDGRQTRAGVVRNLSAGGAFVAVDPPIPIGVGLSFWVPLPGGDPLLLRGHVRWTRSLGGPNGEPVGIGIQFVALDDATRARLDPTGA